MKTREQLLMELVNKKIEGILEPKRLKSIAAHLYGNYAATAAKISIPFLKHITNSLANKPKELNKYVKAYKAATKLFKSIEKIDLDWLVKSVGDAADSIDEHVSIKESSFDDLFVSSTKSDELLEELKEVGNQVKDIYSQK